MSDAPLFDAHCHWHDERLAPHRQTIEAELARLPLERAVVNGTHPEDWEAVASLAENDERVIPAFGLHPWWVNDAPGDWIVRLKDCLQRFPRAGLGEVGLDRWVEGHDLPRQQEALRAQLELAAAENRFISLHCLQAWGPMLDALRDGPLPERGFHLHGYGGSPEMVREFADLGGYFSFSAYIMHERKARQREALVAVPEERLLIETDAPDMLPPGDWQDTKLPGKVAFTHAPQGEPAHHPGNITAAYRAVARVRACPEMALRTLVEKNFRRFFLD